MHGQTPSEFAALRFAEFWFCKERQYHNALWSDDDQVILPALNKAVAYFRVQRNLPKSQDEGMGIPRLKPLLPIIEHAKTLAVADAEMIDAVTSTMIKIDAIYRKKALSFASKLLWLLHQDPFIIYDNQARIALRTPEADYASFVQRWRQGFEESRPQIQKACFTLADHRLYLRCGLEVSESEVKEAAEQEWFLKRVYDIWLWAEGARDNS